MGRLREVRMPKFPECWETCGNCANGEILVESLLVAPGDVVDYDTPLLILETGKVALDIPSPHAGRVIELFVEQYDPIEEGMLLLTLEED